MRDFIVKLSNMDRRFVFLMVGIFTVAPFCIPGGLGLPLPEVTRYTRMVYDELEQLGPDTKPIILSMDYDPGTLAELQPMAEAVLRHIFARKGKVIVVTYMPTGAGLAQETLYRVVGEFPEIEEGVHFAFLGFNYPPSACMQSIGRNIRNNYPKDIRGIQLDDMALFEGVTNYDDIHIVLDLAGNNMPVYWISNAHERFGARFAMGVTNVMAGDFTPYIGRQSQGMLQGMRGAAEYERLIQEAGYWPSLGDATTGMDSQSVTHVLILLLILLGNVGYFLGRKTRGGAS
jgi:hypothetical protein